MADRTIGELTVQITAKDFEKFTRMLIGAKNETEKADSKFDKFGKNVELVGRKMRTAFLVGSGAIAGILAVGDPAGMGVLAMKAEILSRTLARMFVPLERSIGNIIDKITGMFNSLSPGMQDLIGETVSWGVILAGIGWTIAKVVGGAMALWGTIKMVGGAIAALLAAIGVGTGVGLVIGAVAAAIAWIGYSIYRLFKGKEATSEQPTKGMGPINRNQYGAEAFYKYFQSTKGMDIRGTRQEELDTLKKIEENTKAKQRANDVVDNQGLMLA